MPVHVSSTRAHRQEVKIVLYNLWYYHTYRWRPRAQVERGLCTGRPPIDVMIPEALQYNFCPPDDEHIYSKHVEA